MKYNHRHDYTYRDANAVIKAASDKSIYIGLFLFYS